MKKVLIILLCLTSYLAQAQKEIKPSLPKAEKALNEGKFDEAKAIIDVTVASQEFMVDKKGGASKNAAKAWYLKGLIYAGIDTTKVEKFKALEANPYAVAVEAFEKSKALDQGKSASLVNNSFGLPILMNQVEGMLAQSYLNKSVAAYQNDKNYKGAYDLLKRVLYFIPEDTTMLLNAGVYFGPSAEEYDESLVHIQKYIEKGGRSTDAYVQMFSIYRDKKKDNEAALKTAKEMVAKFPANTDFPKYELDMYIKMGRLPDAKAAMERQAAANPTEKEPRFFLGVISSEMKDEKEARKWFEEAVKLDPKYFDAQLGLAEVVYFEAKKVKAEMNQLGNSKADFAKKVELDKLYQEKLRLALPYFEACEKLSPDESKVLDTLYIIYSDLEMAAQVTRVEKRMKTLGLLD